MKTHYSRKFGVAAVILAVALPASFNAFATRAAAQDETTASGTNAAQVTIAPTATYWWVNGNKGKFQQDLGQRAGLAAGIQDFTYTKQIDDKTRVDFNGRAIFGNEDYLLDFKIRKDGWFQLGFGYKQFFTPYNADGLYFSYNGNSAFGSNKANVTNEMGVTRGLFWIDVKTLFPHIPTFTLHYDHAARYGDTGSTIMAGYGITGLTVNRGILPAYSNINESIDTISLDIDQQFKSFSYGAGVWGQHTTTQNATYSISGVTAAVKGNTIGMGNNTTTDAVGAHAYVTGDINKRLSYGAGALYNQFEYDIDSGGRYTFAGTERIFDPISRTNATAANFANILGESTYKEWAGSANLNWRPSKNWSIVPSINFEDYRTDVWSGNAGSSLLINPAPTINNNADNNWFQATEKIEIHYTGLKNWTHTLSVELNQGTGANSFDITGGNQNGYQGTTNQTRYTSKIAYTANWYATSNLSFSGQFYNKNDRNYYDTPAATHVTGNRVYPGFMSCQLFETNDLNIRMTWRPFTWASNVFRYDYQISTVDTAYNKLLANQNLSLGRIQSGKTQTHIISENLTLTPNPRVNINLNGSVVFDQTVIPMNVYFASNMNSTAAAPITSYDSANQTVINADNNYLNAGFNVYYAATDLDDVSLDYNYYKTFNFVNNSRASVPYGVNEHQYVITLGWTRRFNPNLQFTLGYSYIGYKNFAQGGNLNYHANGVTGNLRYRF